MVLGVGAGRQITGAARSAGVWSRAGGSTATLGQPTARVFPGRPALVARSRCPPRDAACVGVWSFPL